MARPRTDDPGGTPISTRRDITIVSGGLWSGSGTAGAPVFTLDIDPVNVGDLLIFSIGSYNQTLATPVAALSGGGVATWYTWNVTLNEPGIYGDGCWTSMWWGIVTTAGPATITWTTPGLADPENLFICREFTAGPGAIWDVYGCVADALPPPIQYVGNWNGNYPSLAPSGAKELYYCAQACGYLGMIPSASSGLVTSTNGGPVANYLLEGYYTPLSYPTVYAPGWVWPGGDQTWNQLAVLVYAS